MTDDDLRKMRDGLVAQMETARAEGCPIPSLLRLLRRFEAYLIADIEAANRELAGKPLWRGSDFRDLKTAIQPFLDEPPERR